MGAKFDPLLAALRTTDVSSGTPSDATTTSKGIVQLAGDLGGTAALPKNKTRTAITIGPVGGTADYVCTGTNDDIQWNAAVTAANGGRISVMGGIYLFANPVSLNLDNTVLEAAGTVTVRYDVHVPQTNFNFNYLINGRITGTTFAKNCVVRGIIFDGDTFNINSTNNASNTSISSTAVGLLEVGDGWLVENCRFGSTAYFRNWVNGDSGGSFIRQNVTIRKCTYYGALPAGSPKQDAIGGGYSDNIIIQECLFTSDLQALSIMDHVVSNNVKFLNNRSYSANSLYIEGGQGWVVAHNTIVGGGSIALQSTQGYDAVNVKNTLNNIISNNVIDGASNLGAIQYTFANGTTSTIKAGNTTITSNKILNAQNAGIIFFGNTSATSGGDIVTDNTIINANTTNANSGQIFSGTGTAQTSGINIMQGYDVSILSNTIVDRRGTALHQFGVQIGQSASPTTNGEPQRITVFDNDILGFVNSEFQNNQPTFTTDIKVRLRGDTYIASGATAGGDLTGTYPNPTLATAGTAGTYAYPASVVTDAKGRVISVITNTSTGTGINVLADSAALTGATSASVAVGANSVPLTVNQNDTTNNPYALVVNNASAKGALRLLQTGILNGENAFLLSSSGAQTTSANSSAFAKFELLSSSSTADILRLENAGTGRTLFINASGNPSNGVVSLNTSGTQRVLDIRRTGALAAGLNTAFIYSNVAETTGESHMKVWLANAASTIPALQVVNAGTGSSLLVNTTDLSVNGGNTGVGIVTPTSKLHVNGSFATAITTTALTTATTLDATYNKVEVNATAAVTITLPTAVGIAGREYWIKKVDSSANAVTIATTSAQTIDGATTKSITTQYNFYHIVSNGTNWSLY